MLRLLDDVIDLSAVESGTLEFATQPGSLAEIVENRISVSLPLAQKKQIQLIFRRKGPVPPANVDRGKVEEVFHILIGNAIKHSEDAAAIELLRVTVKRDRALRTGPRCFSPKPACWTIQGSGQWACNKDYLRTPVLIAGALLRQSRSWCLAFQELVIPRNSSRVKL
jgi:hypothetical protein